MKELLTIFTYTYFLLWALRSTVDSIVNGYKGPPYTNVREIVSFYCFAARSVQFWHDISRHFYSNIKLTKIPLNSAIFREQRTVGLPWLLWLVVSFSYEGYYSGDSKYFLKIVTANSHTHDMCQALPSLVWWGRPLLVFAPNCCCRRMSNCPSLRSARRCLINWSAPSSQAPCALQAKQLRKTLPRLVFKEANPKTSVESRSKYKKKILLLQNCFRFCSMNSLFVLYRDKNSNNTIYESDKTDRLWRSDCDTGYT